MKRDRGFQRMIFIVMTILVILMLLPFIILFMSSFASESSLAQYGYTFWPKEFSTEAYQYIGRNAGSIFKSYGITVLVTIIGTVVGTMITIMLAYPLSRKELAGRNVFMFLIFFTMLFNGGIVPSYIMWTQYFHIKNTIWALILPNLLVGAFNVILAKNYFEYSIPGEIMEAAKVDGASVLQTFWDIAIPLGKPIIATIGMFSILHYWNDFANGLYYINKAEYNSLQVLLTNMLNNIQYLASNSKMAAAAGTSIASLPSISIRMAIAALGILPILVVFPFFQKYFVKGISIGAVKG